MTDYFIMRKGSQHPWSYAKTLEQAQVALAKVKAEYPQDEAWLKDADEYMAEKEASYLSQPLQEITGEAWFYALEVLPPMQWHHSQGVELFCMSEFTDGNVTTQYAKAGERYFCKPVSFNRRETYITPELIAKGAIKVVEG